MVLFLLINSFMAGNILRSPLGKESKIKQVMSKQCNLVKNNWPGVKAQTSQDSVNLSYHPCFDSHGESKSSQKCHKNEKYFGLLKRKHT